MNLDLVFFKITIEIDEDPETRVKVVTVIERFYRRSQSRGGLPDGTLSQIVDSISLRENKVTVTNVVVFSGEGQGLTGIVMRGLSEELATAGFKNQYVFHELETVEGKKRRGKMAATSSQ